MAHRENEYFLRDLDELNELLELAYIVNTAEAARDLLDLEAMPRGHDANGTLLLSRLLHCYVGQPAELEEVVGPGARARGIRSLLHVAASEGHQGIARFLLECGADPSDRDELHRSALHMAAARGRREVALLLLRHGANHRALHCSGKTALHFAAEAATDDERLARALIRRGLGVNDADRIHRNTPLHLAVASSRYKVARLLLRRGADSRLKNANGSTPVHLAVTDERMLQLFLKHRADFRPTDARGVTPLFCLDGTKNYKEAKLIIARLIMEKVVFGIPPGKENEDFMETEKSLRHVRDACFKEILRTRKFVCYQKMTAFDILKLSVPRLAKRLKNRRLSQVLARLNYETEFQHYGRDIKSKLAKARAVKAHSRRVMHFLHQALGNSLPEAVLETIGKYLGPEDIKFA